MSLILKGIDLPKEGEEITLAIFHDGDIVSYKYWLPKDAEAIQIPTPHGRLIDENNIDIPPTNVDMFENCRNCNLLDDEQVKEIIANAPTILESEE